MPGIAHRQVDLRDPAAVDGLIAELRPKTVVHLAALSYVPAADKSPNTMIDCNIAGTFNLTASLSRHCPDAHLVLASSGEVYGVPAEGARITEQSPLRPANLYGVTKLSCEHVVRLPRFAALRATILRLFNHTGVHQSARFVIPAFLSQIAALETSTESTLYVGNLEAYKDFMDIQDVLRGYEKVIAHPVAGTFNVCSGKSHKIADLLTWMLQLAAKPITVRVDKNRWRPHAGGVFEASNRLFCQTFSWQSKIPLKETITRMYTHLKKAHRREDNHVV